MVIYSVIAPNEVNAIADFYVYMLLSIFIFYISLIKNLSQ